MKNLIFLSLLTLASCSSSETSETTTAPEPDTLFSFYEEEPNDIEEMANVIYPEGRTQYEVVGTLPYADEDYVIHVLPDKDGHVIHLTFDAGHTLSYTALVTIQTSTDTGERQVLWSAAVDGTEQALIEIPEGTNFWQMRVERGALFVDEYSWRAEVEVF